jgi:hypothetical protein
VAQVTNIDSSNGDGNGEEQVEVIVSKEDILKKMGDDAPPAEEEGKGVEGYLIFGVIAIGLAAKMIQMRRKHAR